MNLSTNVSVIDLIFPLAECFGAALSLHDDGKVVVAPRFSGLEETSHLFMPEEHRKHHTQRPGTVYKGRD